MTQTDRDTPVTALPHVHEWVLNFDWNGGPSLYPIAQCVVCNVTDIDLASSDDVAEPACTYCAHTLAVHDSTDCGAQDCQCENVANLSSDDVAGSGERWVPQVDSAGREHVEYLDAKAEGRPFPSGGGLHGGGLPFAPTTEAPPKDAPEDTAVAKNDLLEARIARRLTANWTAIRQAKVTPLDVARDIASALRETGALVEKPKP